MSDITKLQIVESAERYGADIIGFASADRFFKDDNIFKIYPKTKTVIGLCFRVLRGLYRGIEEGSVYYQYTTMGVEHIEEVIIPMVLIKLSNLIESMGYHAFPQKRYQNIMTDTDDTNPEVWYDSIERNIENEFEIDFLNTAVKCGLGEKSFKNTLLTNDYGPMVRYCFILTDCKFEETELNKPCLCDNCKKCVSACPGNAIDNNGVVDNWKCAVYYSGANGKTNPFMPKDALMEFNDRIDIISGEAEITKEKAMKILKQIRFYGGVGHGYCSSICGRACDIECYIHLEERGILSKRFKSPFRKRGKWELNIDFYK